MLLKKWRCWETRSNQSHVSGRTWHMPSSPLASKGLPLVSCELCQRQNVSHDRIWDQEYRDQPQRVFDHLIGVVEGKQLERRSCARESEKERGREIQQTNDRDENDGPCGDFAISIPDQHIKRGEPSQQISPTRCANSALAARIADIDCARALLTLQNDRRAKQATSFMSLQRRWGATRAKPLHRDPSSISPRASNARINKLNTFEPVHYSGINHIFRCRITRPMSQNGVCCFRIDIRKPL